MLKVTNLTKTISKSSFKLQDISFHLPKGYICGLIGENGAGKTTLMNVITGLYKMDRVCGGEICINGHSMKEEESLAKESLGIILGDSFYDKNMNLEQIGIFYGELYREFNMEQYLSFLEQFSLDKKQKFKGLSKGMGIKVQLAFALSHNAKLFIFDEPCAGLDKKFREEFLRICVNLVSDGEKSVLISSHITEDLDRIADYIAYIQDGKMLIFDTKENLCDKFLIVKGEAYKCKLIHKAAIVYMEEGEYGASAMVINSRRYAIDDTLKTRIPDIREFMHYFVKGGKANAEAVAQKYFNSQRSK